LDVCRADFVDILNPLIVGTKVIRTLTRAH
jgi:hypothetical protein